MNGEIIDKNDTHHGKAEKCDACKAQVALQAIEEFTQSNIIALNFEKKITEISQRIKNIAKWQRDKGKTSEDYKAKIYFLYIKSILNILKEIGINYAAIVDTYEKDEAIVQYKMGIIGDFDIAGKAFAEYIKALTNKYPGRKIHMTSFENPELELIRGICPFVDEIGDHMGYLVIGDQRQKGEIDTNEIKAILNVVSTKLYNIFSQYFSFIHKQNAEFHKEVSQRDPLTGLLNRKGANDTFESFFKGISRFPEHPCSIIMIDIDNFKLVNDTHGHTIGDHVIKGIASILQNNLRKTDMPVRFGGEEMMVFLPNTDKDDAVLVADKIRGFIEREKFKDCNDKNFKVTASIGVNTISSMLITDMIMKGQSIEAIQKIILDPADKCLYEAKTSGKNKVIGVDNTNTVTYGEKRDESILD